MDIRGIKVQNFNDYPTAKLQKYLIFRFILLISNASELTISPLKGSSIG